MHLALVKEVVILQYFLFLYYCVLTIDSYNLLMLLTYVVHADLYRLYVLTWLYETTRKQIIILTNFQTPKAFHKSYLPPGFGIVITLLFNRCRGNNSGHLCRNNI